MTSRRSAVPCPVVGCDFLAEAASLGHARRSMRGHALRLHGARFEGEGRPLLPLNREELADELQRFRRTQRNSRERRRDTAYELAVRQVVGDCPGLLTRTRSPAALTGDRPGPRARARSPASLVGDVLLDLSDGQVDFEDWGAPVVPPTLPPCRSAEVQTDDVPVRQPAFVLPFGRTESEMVDFLMLHPGLRPSSLVERLVSSTESGSSDESQDAARYWLRVLGGHLRMMASSLLEDLRSSLARDPSGQDAFTTGVECLVRWRRRPDDEDVE